MYLMESFYLIFAHFLLINTTICINTSLNKLRCTNYIFDKYLMCFLVDYNTDYM